MVVVGKGKLTESYNRDLYQDLFYSFQISSDFIRGYKFSGDCFITYPLRSLIIIPEKNKIKKKWKYLLFFSNPTVHPRNPDHIFEKIGIRKKYIIFGKLVNNIFN